MIDQTRVQSGFDVEVLLGAQYLQYLLLLAVEAGTIPVKPPFGEGIVAVLMAPPVLDRTYTPDPGADQLEEGNRDDAFGVEVLLGHPSGADLKVTVRLHLSELSTGREVVGVDLQLFIRLHLDTETAEDGGLDRISLGAELVDVDGGLLPLAAAHEPPISKAELISRLAPNVNRTLDLGGIGTGGRLESFALRKHAAGDAVQAAFGICLNLRLRSGPQPDRFVAPRGDVSAALNFLPPDTNVVFATRADLYGYLGPDARYRRAEPDGDGYSYPIRERPSDKTSDVKGQLLDITVRPPQDSDDVPAPDPNTPRVPGGPQPPPPPSEGGYLTLIVHGDYAIDYLPDPDYRLYIYVFNAIDDEGILTWDADTDFEAGILADIVLAVLSFGLIPVLGPWTVLIFAALEIAKEAAEKIVAGLGFDNPTNAKLDATLLDIAPNRLTILRKRWDPFYETHHQLGLRPGGVNVNKLGVTLQGAAALTKEPKVIRGSVITAAVRNADSTLAGLTYRVAALDDFLPLSTLTAPGTDRGSFTPPGPADDPSLFTVSIDEAIRRVAVEQLERSIPYRIQRIDVRDNHIAAYLMISMQERNGLRDDLTTKHEGEARARIIAEQGDAIRAQVIADFQAKGIIPTDAQVDDEITKQIEALVVADESAYEASSQFGIDLNAATDAAATLVLTPHEAYDLEDSAILDIVELVPIPFHPRPGGYFRDRYVRAEEPTVAARLADNLRSKPHFHQTPEGEVVLD